MVRRISSSRPIDAVFLQRLALLLGVLALHLLAAAQLLDGRFQIGLVRAGRLQRGTQLALVLQRRQHEQLAGDELVAALLRQLVGEVEQAVEIIAEVDVAFLPGDPRQALEQLVHALREHRHVDLRLGQQRAGRAALLAEQGRHHVHRFEHVVVAAHGQRLGVGQRLLETRREFVHSHVEKSPHR
jgi:hypothetical protein